MKKVQTAFAVYYPYDGLVTDEDSLELAKSTVKDNEAIVAGEGHFSHDEVKTYVGSYVVIWNGVEWEKYEE